MESYLRRLCVEYIDIFLEGDNRIMGSIFGFRLERAKEKVLARPVSEMIACIEKDRHLQPEQREMLRNAMYSAFSASCRGKTEYLDGLLR